MRLRGDLPQRLRAAIDTSRYDLVLGPDAIVFKEKGKKGLAEIRLVPPGGAVCVRWDIEDNLFGFLMNENNADGAFFVLRHGDDVEAHVVECKRTLNRGVWSKSKKQMRATLLRLRALSGVLGLTITRVVCYSAFYQEEQLARTPANPFAPKLPIGGGTTPTLARQESLAILREQYGWYADTVELRDIEGRHTHRRLKLDRKDPSIRLEDDVCVGSFEIDLA